jgi:hypothetical protein
MEEINNDGKQERAAGRSERICCQINVE